MNEQYGNSGYNRVGDNPYDQRDGGAQGGRYNNYAERPYNDRTSLPLAAPDTTLTYHSTRRRDAILFWRRRQPSGHPRRMP
jgi:hypothetical protein